jgi:hypothetical protein
MFDGPEGSRDTDTGTARRSAGWARASWHWRRHLGRRIGRLIIWSARELRRAGFGPFFVSQPGNAGKGPGPRVPSQHTHDSVPGQSGDGAGVSGVSNPHTQSRAELTKSFSEPQIAPEILWIRSPTPALFFVPSRKSRGANRHNRSHPEDPARPDPTRTTTAQADRSLHRDILRSPGVESLEKETRPTLAKPPVTCDPAVLSATAVDRAGFFQKKKMLGFRRNCGSLS